MREDADRMRFKRQLAYASFVLPASRPAHRCPEFFKQSPPHLCMFQVQHYFNHFFNPFYALIVAFFTSCWRASQRPCNNGFTILWNNATRRLLGRVNVNKNK